MVIFLYNLDIFVWIQSGCLAKTVFFLDPSNSVIKRLWCVNIFLISPQKDKLLVLIRSALMR